MSCFAYLRVIPYFNFDSPYFPLAALFMAHVFLIKHHTGSALLGLVLAGSCVLGNEEIKVKNQACGRRRYGVWRSLFPPSSLLCSYPGILPTLFVSKFVKLSNFVSMFENLASLLGAVRKMEVWWGGPGSAISFCHQECKMKDPGV